MDLTNIANKEEEKKKASPFLNWEIEGFWSYLLCISNSILLP